MSELIDKVIDEQAITKQITFLDSQLIKAGTSLGTCADAAKKFMDQFANAKGVSDVVSIMSEYNKTLLQAQKAQTEISVAEKNRADKLLVLQKVQESNAKTELINAQAIAATQKAQEATTKAEQTRADAAAKVAAAAEKETKAEQELMSAKQMMINILTKEGVSVDKMNMTKSQASTINKLVATANGAEKGSHEQLAAQYDLNYKAYNKLSAVQKDTTAGKAMLASIGEQSKALKGMEGPMGNFTRDVGNYKNNILSALGANQGFIGNLANMAMGAEKTGTSFATAGVGGIKAFGTAMLELLANPVVAILAAIAAAIMLVKAAIESNGEATNKLNQVLAPFKELLTFIMSIFSQLVTVILSGVLELEKFANVIMSVIPGLDKLAEKNLQAIELEKQKQKLAADMRADILRDAKEEVVIMENRNKARQKDKYSIADRLTFLKTADAMELALSQDHVELATRAFNLKKQQMEEEGRTYEMLTKDEKDAYVNMEAEIYKAKSEYFQKTTRLKSMQATLVMEDQQDQIAVVESSNKLKLEQLKTNANFDNLNSKQKIAFNKKYSDQDIKDQMSLIKAKENLAGANVEDLQGQYDILLTQLKQNNQKMSAEISSYNIQMLQKQNDSNLLKFQSDHNYDTMTFEEKVKYDNDYFAWDQQGKQKVLDLQKKYNKITSDEYRIANENLKSEKKIFITQQANTMIQQSELLLSEQKSYLDSQVKLDQDYGNKSVGYQQEITRKLFEIQADLDTRLAEEQYKNNQIDIVAFQTKLSNIKAQRAALLEAQKTGSENDERTRIIALESDTSVKRRKIQDDLYLSGKISSLEYQTSILKINKDGSDNQLAIEIWLDKEKLATLREGSEEQIKLQQKINNEEENLEEKKANRKIHAEKELQKKIIELIKASASAIQTIGDDQYQDKLDKIDALKTANSDAATKENDEITKKLNSGILSQKEADAQSAAIDAQKTERDKQLTAQENEIKTKQAIFDKESSAFNIILSTGEAIMASVAAFPLTAGMPFAGIDAAIGAVELAAVLAKPLPAYAFGTLDHPGGPALVGEVKPEMIQTPDNKIMKVDVPTIMSLPAHTKVFPDYDKALQEMAFNASIRSMYDSVPDIEISTYNDAMMRKYMGSLVGQTEKQNSKLDKLNNLDKHLGDIANNTRNLEGVLKGLKKNPWFS